MKIFIREHRDLTVLCLIQLLAVSMIFWFGAYRNGWTLSYAIFLELFLFLFFLVYRYIRNKALYQQLAQPPKKLEETIPFVTGGALAESIQQLLTAQYRLYQAELYAYQKKQTEHLHFINLWVHQMKTPLAVISLIVQEAENEYSKQIQTELDKVADGLEMAIYIARLEDFAQDFQVQRVELKAFLLQALKENKRLFIQHSIFPELDVAEEIAIYSDQKWLGFVLKQLWSNAVRYSAGKGKKVFITAEQMADKVELSIRDEGMGIPIEDQRRVFEVHYTGENGRKVHESTGMGLYLVREICSKLHHQVELSSAVGVGTTIKIIVPVVKLTKL